MYKIINEFFDGEINLSHRIYLETIMLKQRNFQTYFNEKLFELYNISKSIKRVKNKISNQRLCRFL